MSVLRVFWTSAPDGQLLSASLNSGAWLTGQALNVSMTQVVTGFDHNILCSTCPVCIHNGYSAFLFVGESLSKSPVSLSHSQHLTTQGDARMGPVDEGMCIL